MWQVMKSVARGGVHRGLSALAIRMACRVSSRIFSLGRKPSPWSLFFRVKGGTLLTAHSYAKKEGLGMRIYSKAW